MSGGRHPASAEFLQVTYDRRAELDRLYATVEDVAYRLADQQTLGFDEHYMIINSLIDARIDDSHLLNSVFASGSNAIRGAIMPQVRVTTFKLAVEGQDSHLALEDGFAGTTEGDEGVFIGELQNIEPRLNDDMQLDDLSLVLHAATPDVEEEIWRFGFMPGGVEEQILYVPIKGLLQLHVVGPDPAYYIDETAAPRFIATHAEDFDQSPDLVVGYENLLGPPLEGPHRGVLN